MMPIKIENQLYYLYRINQWIPGKSLCKVELFKISIIDDPDFYYGINYEQTPALVSGIDSNGDLMIIPDKTPYLQIPPNPQKTINLQTQPLFDTTQLNSDGSLQLSSGKNYYPKNASGIVVGENNIINNDNFFVKGNNNTILSDGVVLINSDNVTVQEGLTNVFVIGSTGGTITESNTTIINNTIYLTPKYVWVDNTGFTLDLSFANTTIIYYNTSAVTYIEVPSNVDFPVGTKINFIQDTYAGQIFIWWLETGPHVVSLNGATISIGPGAYMSLEKIDTNYWILYGDITAWV